MKRFLSFTALLVVSCLAVYLWGEYRSAQQRQDAERSLERVSRIARERQGEIDRLRQKLDRLEAWGYLVTFQEALHAIELDIQELNYGHALAKLEALDAKIRSGELGSLLAGEADRLADEVDALREELQGMGDDASARLRRLGRAAFDALSGFAVEQIPVAANAPDPATEEESLEVGEQESEEEPDLGGEGVH